MPDDFPGLEQPLVIEQIHPKLSIDVDALTALIERTVAGEDGKLAALSVVLGDHKLIRELNVKWLEHDYNTDVLAFPLGEHGTGKVVDGEIYVDLDTANERAPEFNVTFEAEARRYVCHGLLHLLGYVDDTPAGKQKMQALEDKYLQQ